MNNREKGFINYPKPDVVYIDVDVGVCTAEGISAAVQ